MVVLTAVKKSAIIICHFREWQLVSNGNNLLFVSTSKEEILLVESSNHR